LDDTFGRATAWMPPTSKLLKQDIRNVVRPLASTQISTSGVILGRCRNQPLRKTLRILDDTFWRATSWMPPTSKLLNQDIRNVVRPLPSTQISTSGVILGRCRNQPFPTTLRTLDDTFGRATAWMPPTSKLLKQDIRNVVRPLPSTQLSTSGVILGRCR